MLNIDFEKYPEIYKYVGEAAKQPHMKPNKLTILDNETFLSIVETWIKKYEEDIDNMVENTFMVFGVTGEETGYQAMAQDWKRRKEVFKFERRIDRELIRKWWNEKFTACICHLYQSWNEKDCFKTLKGGASGCMITCSFRVQFLDSDYKSVKYNVVTDFNMYLQIDNSLHTEIDMYDL